MNLAAATLENAWVRLEPFDAHRHRSGLVNAAHSDESIFQHMPFPVAEHGYGIWFDWLLREQAAERQLPFAVISKQSRISKDLATERQKLHESGQALARQFSFPPSEEEIVGQTCYLAIRPEHSGVEIGGTWYTREAQATAINPAAKLLLITHAFACGAERVEFKTDALNVQSRGALTKLGATFEGIFRRQMRRPNGTMRDNAYFSIIRDEWDEVRALIEARLATF